MLMLLKKYNPSLAAGFLLLYVAAAFQSPLLEGLHTLAHFLDHGHHHQHHHFHNHSNDSSEHGHELLTVAGEVMGQIAGEPAPAKGNAEKIKKKLTDHAVIIRGGPCPASFSGQKPERPVLWPSALFVPVPTPPPRRA